MAQITPAAPFLMVQREFSAIRLAKVLLCVVAVYCGGLSQTGNGAVSRSLVGAVGTDGVAQNTGGPNGSTVFICGSYIDRTGQFFSSNARNIPPVLAGTGAF